MPFTPNPLGPSIGAQIMHYTMNPHLETPYNPITSRDTIGQPIRNQVFERSSTGEPIWGSRVTSRDSIGQPSYIPVNDLTRTPTYRFDNLGSLGSLSSYQSEIIKEHAQAELRRKRGEMISLQDAMKFNPIKISEAMRESIQAEIRRKNGYF